MRPTPRPSSRSTAPTRQPSKWATYADLGATITGPHANLNLGIHLFLNGSPVDAIQLDTTQPQPTPSTTSPGKGGSLPSGLSVGWVFNLEAVRAFYRRQKHPPGR